MTYVPPTIDEFKGQFRRDFPFAVPAYGAAAVASIAAGSVTGLAVVAAGLFYSLAPTVSIAAPQSAGVTALATATLVAGKVTGFVVTNAGSGYTAAPVVTITPAAGDGDNSNLDKVCDIDITAALADAGVNFNPGLWESQAVYARAFGLLAAHYLVTNLQASAVGVQGQNDWLRTSKHAGDLSESFQIPPSIAANPFLALLGKTTYGASYLSMLAPRLVGNVIGLYGRTSID